jgi:dTDP-4-amino-4,6-dideoxygalactose transaminase
MAAEVLSIPMAPHVSDVEAQYIVEQLAAFAR